MNIIFDLDGTLINSKDRLYQLFSFLAPEIKLSFEEYWHYKSNKISNFDILKKYLDADHERIRSFNEHWMALIESDEYLALDTPFFGVEGFLVILSGFAKLHVCTARQSKQKALDQLNRLHLLPHFDNILVTKQVESKESLILTNIFDINAKDWIVGDTGKDIQTGHALGIRTCAVLSGFLNKESLAPYFPDLMIDVVTDYNFRDV